MNDCDNDKDKEEPVVIRRKPRFIPLKNPLKDVVERTEDEFKRLCLGSFEMAVKEWEEQEERFKKTLLTYREEMKALRQRMKDSYQELYQFMLNHVYDDDKKELLEAIGLMLEHPEYAETYADIIKTAIRFINEGKRPGMIHDGAHYVYGTKPLYFDFFE